MLKYAIHRLEGFPSEEIKNFFTETLIKGEQVLNSPSFKLQILTNSYPSKSFFRTKYIEGFYGLNMSNENFYNLIMSGKEKANSEGEDHEIDLLVKVVKMPPGILGSMNPGNPIYNISKDFLVDCYNLNRPFDLFGNNTHEYVHHLGLYHKTKIQSKRKYDPAYGVGKIAREIYYNANTPMGSIIKIDDFTWLNQSCC